MPRARRKLCGFLLVGVLLATCASSIQAKTPKPTVQALLTNPLAPLTGLVLTTAIDEVDAVYSFNLRYHHVLTRRVGVTVIPSFTGAEILGLHFRSVGVKLGPRLAFSDAGLEGFFVTPFAMLGGIWAVRAENTLTSAGLWGMGAEAGHTFVWGAFVLELAAGAQFSAHWAHRAFDASSMPGDGWSPALNVSLGYGW